MNLFDIIVLSITSISLITGFFKGFVYLLIGFILFGCSLISAYFLEPFVKDIAVDYIKSDLIAGIASGVLSYLLSTIFFSLVSSQIKSVIKDFRGGAIDRLFGSILGAAKGLLISLTIFSIIAIVSSNAYVGNSNLQELADKVDKEHYPKFITSAKTYNLLSYASKIVMFCIPKKMLEKIELPSKPKALDDMENPSLNIKIDKDQSIKMSIDNPLINSSSSSSKSSSEDDLESELEKLLRDEAK